jgi:adenylate cyclase class IV
VSAPLPPLEREVKAVVDDPPALGRRLQARGATLAFRGRMSDRRFDRPDGTMTARDEVLRVRTYRAAPGSDSRPAELAWKGPTRRTEGYKEREEHQVVLEDPAALATILERLGFTVCDSIDRGIEVYDLPGTTVRLEWYPRMDVLVEVEGEPDAIERAVQATGLARDAFTGDRLLDFAERYRRRTGTAPILALAALGSARPAWPAWADAPPSGRHGAAVR